MWTGMRPALLITFIARIELFNGVVAYVRCEMVIDLCVCISICDALIGVESYVDAILCQVVRRAAMPVVNLEVALLRMLRIVQEPRQEIGKVGDYQSHDAD